MSGRGFWTKTAAGLAIHVNGRRDMSDKTLATISELSDLVALVYERRKLLNTLRRRAGLPTVEYRPAREYRPMV